MLGDLNSKHIEQVLHSLIIGRIGCHADNRTYVVTVPMLMTEHISTNILRQV